jgi:hypothetical protein
MCHYWEKDYSRKSTRDAKPKVQGGGPYQSRARILLSPVCLFLVSTTPTADKQNCSTSLVVASGSGLGVQKCGDSVLFWGITALVNSGEK